MSALAKFHDAFLQLIEVAKLSIGPYGSNELVLTLVTALPVNRCIDVFAVGFHMDHHSIDQAAHDRLAISVTRACRVP